MTDPQSATPEADVQALADTRCPYVATDPNTTRRPREDGWRCGRDAGEPHNHTLYTVDGEHTLYAGTWVLPAPEPTDQTREQIAEALAEWFCERCDLSAEHHREGGRSSECVWAPTLQVRMSPHALASRLAVHVSPETAEEREGCGICGQCHVDHEGDRLLIEWQKGEIARLETEAEQMRDEAAAIARAGGRRG